MTRVTAICLCGALLFACTACERRQRAEERRGSVLQDYVEKPIRRAEDARRQVEERQRKMLEAAGEPVPPEE